MHRILVINFGRMGDLLQMAPMITYLKEQHPQSEIGLLAAANFAQTARGLPGVDYVHAIPLTEYMLPLKDGSLGDNYRHFKELITELKSCEYTKVFNLTHNRLGAALSSLIAGEVEGLRLDKRGNMYVDNPWLSLFYNSSVNRGLNQFNIVDLYRLAAGYSVEQRTVDNSHLRFVLSGEDRRAAEQLLGNYRIDYSKKVVGIQAGASTEEKRWLESSFNTAARKLAGEYNIFFFGSGKESEIVAQAWEGVPGAVNLCGKTGVGTLAAVLERCSLLISNDTGTQHLAAALRVPVLSLTIGPALASETGPFGEGNIIVEPDLECMPCSYAYKCQNPVCRAVIPPGLVVWLAGKMLDYQEITVIPAELSRGCRIAKTAFDDDGLWELQPIKASGFILRDRVNIAYRKSWTSLINANNIIDIDHRISDGKEVAQELNAILVHLNKLLELSAEGQIQAEKLVELAQIDKLDLTNIKQAGERIALIDSSINLTGEKCKELRPLTLNFNLGKEALPEAGLSKLAEKTKALYQRLNSASLLFKKYLTEQYSGEEQSISAAKIRIKRPSSRVLAVDAPYFVTGEIIRGLQRAGAEVELMGLNDNYKDNAQAGVIFIEKLLDRLQEYRPDFLLTVNHLGFDAQGFLVKELERLEIKSAVYYVDSPLFVLDDPGKLVSDASVIFCWDDYYLGRLKAYGFRNLEYLPLGTDERVFYPRDSAVIPMEYQPAIAYAADSLTSRSAEHAEYLTAEMNSPAVAEKITALMQVNNQAAPEILEAVAEGFKFQSSEQKRHFLAAWIMKVHQPQRLEVLKKLSPLGLKIFGDEDWRLHFDNGQPDLAGRLRYFEQLPLLYAGMKIGFNSTSPQMPTGVNQRVFDIPAAGGFILTDYREALEDIFKPEQEIAVYHSAQEAHEKAAFFLSQPEIRRKMSESARAKILAGHTYKHRAEFILKRMSNIVNIYQEKRELRELPAAKADSEKAAAAEIELMDNFPEKVDIPSEISRHIFGEKHLIIAPSRAAWVVTDKMGAEIIERLHRGDTIGQTAAVLVKEYGQSSSQALRKVKELIELCNQQNFRESFDTASLDLDQRARNLQLFLTRRCNLKCRHCYFSAGQPMAGELTTEQWKDIIRKFARLGAGNVVTLTGGEPMMRNDFFEIAAEAVNRGLKVVLLSNGGLIRERETAIRLAEMVDTAQISLDGTTAAVNDAIRGDGSYEDAVRAIRLLLAEKVDVEMTIVVLPENVADLEKNLSAFAQSLGGGRLKCALAVANAKGRLKGKLKDEPESLVGRILTAVGSQKWIRQGKFLSGCTIFGCELATSIVVNPEGKIGNCPYLNYSGPHSALDADFAQLVTQDCAWHREAMERSKKCQECDLRNFQCGGCRIFGECGEQTKLRNYYRMLEEK